MKKDTIVYEIGNSLYVNLTNKCSNSCDFCVRNHADGVEDYYLWLNNEPTAEEVIALIPQPSKYDEIVFCGFGEPTERFDDMMTVAKYVKDNGGNTRVNTNGHANLITGRDVTEEMGKYIDTVSISLNATDAGKYQEVCKSAFGEEAYGAMLDFAARCVKTCKRVVLSVVEVIGEEEIEKAKVIAKGVGAELRVRTYIE